MFKDPSLCLITQAQDDAEEPKTFATKFFLIFYTIFYMEVKRLQRHKRFDKLVRTPWLHSNSAFRLY